jgi:hypothetical protein
MNTMNRFSRIVKSFVHSIHKGRKVKLSKIWPKNDQSSLQPVEQQNSILAFYIIENSILLTVDIHIAEEEHDILLENTMTLKYTFPPRNFMIDNFNKILSLFYEYICLL